MEIMFRKKKNENKIHNFLIISIDTIIIIMHTKYAIQVIKIKKKEI